MSHLDNFSMTRNAQDNAHVFVECVNKSGRFDVSDTNFVSLTGINFVGCRLSVETMLFTRLDTLHLKIQSLRVLKTDKAQR